MMRGGSPEPGLFTPQTPIGVVPDEDDEIDALGVRRLTVCAACASTSASVSGQGDDCEHADDLPVVQEREKRRACAGRERRKR